MRTRLCSYGLCAYKSVYVTALEWVCDRYCVEDYQIQGGSHKWTKEPEAEAEAAARHGG